DLDRPGLNRARPRFRAGGAVVSSYSYGVNALGQRETVTTSGPAMAAPATTRWGYDALGQLVSEDFANNQSANPRDRGYAYDLIGNREHSIQGSTNPLASGNLAYDADSLNQYDSIGTFQPVHDDDGNLTTGQLHSAALVNLTGTAYTGTLHWNGENRLTKVEDGATVKATYQYDFMGRRVRKQVGNAVTWYVYDGFNELGRFTQNGTTAPAIERTYTWGLDLSNTPQGAGGVGGLLAIKIHHPQSTIYYPTYDANGNISEYLAANGSVAAHFEYDGFGNTVVNTDTNGLFDYRFSTKPLEDVTGLYYYGYRYYDPVTGRWPSRDPIAEKGGVNLYAFVGNSPLFQIDRLGLACSVVPDGEGGYKLECTEDPNSWDLTEVNDFTFDKRTGNLKINSRLIKGIIAGLRIEFEGFELSNELPKIENKIKELLESKADTLPEKICLGAVYFGGQFLLSEKIGGGIVIWSHEEIEVSVEGLIDFDTGEHRCPVISRTNSID
ncbi:MAG: RHS repeat-associated core domain-containing protein, partial [Verrucomicrobiae bacterium]|nr:RHS repeat-associated core domain-containing protein [Verrucomicrobiae bacterium]